jgi:hypothetical protein
MFMTNSTLTLVNVQPTPVTLPELAEQINAEHRQCEAALQSGLQHALEAGRLLIEAKKLCLHGTWLPWLEENFEGKNRTARAYMQVAQRWPEVEANRQHVANLSYREVLRLVAEPSPEPEPEPDLNRVPSDKDFLASIPELTSEKILIGVLPEDESFMVELRPHESLPGYFYLAVYQDLNTDSAEMVYDKRGGKYSRELLGYALERVHKVKPTVWNYEPLKHQSFEEADANDENYNQLKKYAYLLAASSSKEEIAGFLHDVAVFVITTNNKAVSVSKLKNLASTIRQRK